MRDDGVYHSRLSKKRDDYFALQYAENSKFVSVASAEHRQSEKFVEDLYSNNSEGVKKFLGDHNMGANLVAKTSRTIILMDGTGSMGHLLQKAKNNVETMFERSVEILKANGLPPDMIQMQFVVYRDYDCKEDLLQTSSWENKPENLRMFMQNVGPKGGGDYEEAIEIGLWHANEEHRTVGIAQVILIGDAPAKSVKQITQYRNTYGGESYWTAGKFKKPTFYKDEMMELAKNKIPVHAFFVEDGAEANFREIANATGGRCEKLNVNGEDGATLLTNVVTEEILRKAGQSAGQGDKLAEEYRKKYIKSHTG